MVHQTTNNTEDAEAQFVEIFPNLSSMASKIHPITGETLYVGNNGSLIFQTTLSYHSGRYLCHISNGIGQAIHHITQLNVKGMTCFIFIRRARKT